MARRVCGISRVDSTWPALAEVHLWPTSFIMTTIRPLLRDPSTSVGIALATSTVRYESSTQQHPGIRGLLSFGSICLARPLLSPAELRFALGGWCADMRSPFLENKMKRQDSHADASNTMRPASAALGPDHISTVLRPPACMLKTFSDFPLVQCLVLRRRWRNQTGSCWKGTASIHYDIPRVPRRQRLTVERCVRTYTALAATGTLDSAIRSSTHSRPK